MFVNGELFRPGGQLAHTNYVAHGRKCWCGQYGCIEQYVSEKIICQELYCSSVKELRLKSEMNNTFIVDALYEYGDKLGTVIASFLHMLPMENIVLYGDLFFAESALTAGLVYQRVDCKKYPSMGLLALFYLV